MEEQTQSGDDPPFDGNTTQPMEAQPFNVQGNNYTYLNPKPKTQARTFIAQAVWLQLANQPTLNTPDQNNTQPHTEPELPNRIQLIFLPTRKTFPKEFGKLKRNLRQRLLCGLFNREPKALRGPKWPFNNKIITI